MNFLCRLNDRGRTEYGKEKTDNFTLLLCPHFIDLLKIRFSSNSLSNYLLNKKPELKSGDFLVHGNNVCEKNQTNKGEKALYLRLFEIQFDYYNKNSNNCKKRNKITFLSSDFFAE